LIDFYLPGPKPLLAETGQPYLVPIQEDIDAMSVITIIDTIIKVTNFFMFK
jgi:hypothetical protein